MSKEKEKKPNYSTCLSFGMLFGVVLGSYLLLIYNYLYIIYIY